MEILFAADSFEWDAGNKDKNRIKHQVSIMECEEVFFDTHKKLLKDNIHSEREQRFVLVGRTPQQRILLVVFTIRKNRIRVISARDINKKERTLYEKKH